MLSLNQDFREFIELLNVHEVEYLVVGGYAVAFHGRPRFTGDIDLWIAISTNNAKRVIQVLEDFGFASIGLTTIDLQQEDIVIQLGYEPNRIDILTSVTGLTFDVCFSRSVKANLDGLLVNFIHINDLKINKAATGRGKDIGDLENLP
ncbi:nucleotidyltransferase [Spirosoma sp. KUDC1026]|uniref:nucleotidyltransferase n=1 Tax=Spirosoma sp. KUDC1026 TaxID=2745947 RepID=UPI00159B914E|nr:nucleotidyltransferase [Spirosoma sp. KUDC1026]QKZ14782.1 nucleotidyltransferase [Spirosoma sp. KUDC1026]